MTSRDFSFWLQGFFEVQEPTEITPKQTEMIKRHLGLVFKHEIDPSYSDDPKVQEELNEIHNGSKPENKPNGIHGYDPEGVMRC